jgi:serine/threonine-protein kinase HipA
MHEGGWKRPIGTTPTTHIFKLPIGKIEHAGIDLSNSVENEWLCLEILKGFGIPVPTAEIKVFEDSKVLVVERFDRKFSDDDRWIIRHPIEDMCQVNGISPGRKYESDGGPGISKIMEVLGSSLRPEEDRKLFMQTVFLFWLLGAPDGHAKNFSIFLKKGGRFQLTPIYDVISAYPLVGNREYDRQKVIMAMALSGKNRHYKWGEMLPRHWFEESRKSNFHRTEMQMIIEQTLSKLDRVIQKVVSELPKSVPDDISTSIFDGMKEAARRFGSLDNS